MPNLPPRNLPFSSPDSLSKTSAQVSKPAKGRVSLQSANSTPAEDRNGADDRSGVLPRQDETTYHRKLRNLLWDFRRAYERWIDLVSLQGAKAVASVARSAASIDELLAKEAKEIPRDLKQSDSEAIWNRGRRMEEMAVILKDIDEAGEEIKDVMSKIQSASMKFAALSEAAEALLVEATQAKGSEFTFDKEMWVSWSMERFVWALQIVASRCIIQTSHLQYFAEWLLNEGCAPGAPPASQLLEDDKRRSQKEEEEDEEEIEESDGEEFEGERHTNKLKRKGRGRVRERVLEGWKDLAILHDESSEMCAELLEDVCEVEVGRWEER